MASSSGGMFGTPGSSGNANMMMPVSPQGFIEEIEYDEIDFMEVVGSGAFGVVTRARWRNHIVAVKTIGDKAETFKAEVQQLSSVDHANIIKLYGICNQKSKVCLVMEFADCGSLYTVIHPSEQTPRIEYHFSHVVHWALQCANAVRYLHGMKPKAIIHRDLKPPNMLLTNQGSTLKICDFGTACYIHSNMTSNQGSAAWMAPEVFEGSNYSEKCDVYSFGIVLWEMITRYKPYQELYHHPYRVMWAVHEGIRPPDVRNIPKSLQNLIKSSWHRDMHARPPFVEIVEYFERASKYVSLDDRFLDMQPSSHDSDSQSSYYTDESFDQFTSSAVKTSIPLSEGSQGRSPMGSNDVALAEQDSSLEQLPKSDISEADGTKPPEPVQCSQPEQSVSLNLGTDLKTPTAVSGHRRASSWCDAASMHRKISDSLLDEFRQYESSTSLQNTGNAQYYGDSFPPVILHDEEAARKQSYTGQSQTFTDSFPPTSFAPSTTHGMMEPSLLVGNSAAHSVINFPPRPYVSPSGRFPLPPSNHLSHNAMSATGILMTHDVNHRQSAPYAPINQPSQMGHHYPLQGSCSDGSGQMATPPPLYVSPSTYHQQQQMLSQQQHHLTEQYYQSQVPTPLQEFNHQLDLGTPVVDVITMQHDLANSFGRVSPLPARSFTLPASFRNSGHTSNSSSGRSTPVSVSPPHDIVKIDRGRNQSPRVHFSRAESHPAMPQQRETTFRRHQSDLDRSDFWLLLAPELMPATPIADNNESMVIYKKHLELVDRYVKLQGELDYLMQRKSDVQKQLAEEEKEQRRSSHFLENYLKAQEEQEEVAVLHASIKAQLEKVKQKRTNQRF